MNVLTTVLVTGSTDGVGRLVAKHFASEGAVVLLHGRNPTKGAKVLEALRQETGNQALEFYCADLASLADVRRLAARIKTRHPRLDLLINNAGIGGGRFVPTGPAGAFEEERNPEPLEQSQDGHELRFAVNALAGFLLANLLLPELHRSPSGRVVWTSSVAQAPFDFEDVRLAHGQSRMDAYRRSKLAQVTFSFELAERMSATSLTSVALHPASLMDTKMVIEETGMPPRAMVEDGADAIVHAATHEAFAGRQELFLYQKSPERARDEQPYDPAARDRLWSLAAKLSGLDA